MEYKGATIEIDGDVVMWRLVNNQGKIHGGEANTIKGAKQQITRYVEKGEIRKQDHPTKY